MAEKTMMKLLEIIVWDYLWGVPLIAISLFVGVYFTLFSGFFQFRFLRHISKVVYEKLFSKNELEEKGTISALEALSIAIGATIGVGNIAGVATAIAVGGPGAVFWLWVAGLLGQIIKMVEVSLAVHYRNTSETGACFGGPTYYIQKGLGVEKGMKILPRILSFLFIFGFGIGFFLTLQNYTVSEAISSTFDVSMIHVSVIYTVLLYLMISGGLPALGKIAARLVPFMCLFYILGGLFIILLNVELLPATFSLIFDGAFSGTAAAGGFAGAAFSKVIKIGISRAVFSSEAGWGSSPMIHASAKTDHPCRQGIMGVFEVFVDTIVVCTITSLVIIITGEWSSGASGADLTLSAFEVGIGVTGRTILAVGVLLFGITTSSGLYAQIEVLVRYLLGEGRKAEKAILRIYKWSYPLPGLALVIYAVAQDMPGTHVWLFADMATAFPIFANLIALLLLSRKFFQLLGDYKARYLNIGTVDPDFAVFHDSGRKNVV